MNIHHLELFYYVARYRGISAAVRHMPYGIQQPAVSSQILQLEEHLGGKLFERQPFKLTPIGTELWAFVQPFFDNIEPVANRLRQGSVPQLRIGSSETILRDHMPVILKHVKEENPLLRLSVRGGLQLQLEGWLRDQEIDLAILPLCRRLPPPFRTIPLLRLPLKLLVPRRSPYKAAAEVWANGRPAEALISLPPSDTITQVFQRGLKRLGVTWPQGLETSSLPLVSQYVANGDGIGVTVDVPVLVRNPGVRALPLEGFDELELLAAWRGEPTPLIRSLLTEMQRYAQLFRPEAAAEAEEAGDGSDAPAPVADPKPAAAPRRRGAAAGKQAKVSG